MLFYLTLISFGLCRDLRVFFRGFCLGAPAGVSQVSVFTSPLEWVGLALCSILIPCLGRCLSQWLRIFGMVAIRRFRVPHGLVVVIVFLNGVLCGIYLLCMPFPPKGQRASQPDWLLLVVWRVGGCDLLSYSACSRFQYRWYKMRLMPVLSMIPLVLSLVVAIHEVLTMVFVLGILPSRVCCRAMVRSAFG